VLEDIMDDDKKITIIEGPPPTFEIVYDVWANGIMDAANQASIAVTRLRTFNGPQLVERCYHAWNQRELINLEFRSTDGMTLEVPIIAARATESHEGQLLFLWVRLPDDEVEIDFLYEEDLDDGDIDGDNDIDADGDIYDVDGFEEDEGDGLDPSV
jgi:hypothetical protein